jgi:nicotinamide riboside transporter PnuC
MGIITERWKKVPMWMRFCFILFGIPTIIAIFQVVLEGFTPRLTAKMILLSILIVCSLPLILPKFQPKTFTPLHTLGKKREFRKIVSVSSALWAVIFFVGSIISLFVAVTAGEHWLLCAICGINSIVGFILALYFSMVSRKQITSKRSISFRVPFSS